MIDNAVPTIEKVAEWLSESDSSKKRKFSYLEPADSESERRNILRVAESKIRKRIDGYDST